MGERTVFVVGAGPMQVPAILEAKKLGLRVIASDGNKAAPGLDLADEAIVCDAYDIEGHLGAAYTFKPDGVFSGGDFAVTVAHMRMMMKLPGIPPWVARRTKNKLTAKQAFIEHGIPSPKLYVGEPERYPCIVKPVDASASRGITIVHEPGALKAAKEKACRASPLASCLVEEYVQGPEQSVEMCVDERGEHWSFGVVDRHFDGVIETGHTNPSNLETGKLNALVDLTQRAAVALGIDCGPYKSDTIWTERGPMILELAARVSGGWHSQSTTPLARGAFPIRTALKLAVGMPTTSDDYIATRDRHAVCRALFPPPGVVREIVIPDGTPGLQFISVKVGDTIKPYEDCAGRPGFVVGAGYTREEAEKVVARAAELVRIETQ